MGLPYLGEHACEQRTGHGMLLERRYVVTRNDREGFWVQLHAAAASHGVLDRQQIVWLSDGGSYFIDRSAELLQDQPLVPVVDIQHARRHVWETGHKLTSDKNAAGAWVAPHIRAVDEGGALGVVLDLAEQRQRPTSTEQRKAIDALSGYVGSYRTWLRAPASSARARRPAWIGWRFDRPPSAPRSSTQAPRLVWPTVQQPSWDASRCSPPCGC